MGGLELQQRRKASTWASEGWAPSAATQTLLSFVILFCPAPLGSLVNSPRPPSSHCPPGVGGGVTD